MLCEGKYAVVVSVATDFNRGDQALLWETQRIAEDALDVDQVLILENDNEDLHQSIAKGMKVISAILHHPTYSIKNKKNYSNLNYTLKLKIIWGVIAIKDFCLYGMLLNKITQKIGYLFLNDEQKKTYQLLKNCDAVFVKGGGFLHSYGKVTDFYYIYYSLYHIRLAQKLAKKVYFLPNSYGPFKGMYVKGLVKKTLSKCAILTSRESISQLNLYQLGIHNGNVFSDMAFLLRNKESEMTKEIEKKYDLMRGNNKIAITVRPIRFPGAVKPMESYKNYIESMVKFINWLQNSGYRPILIEHSYSKNDNENDRICIDKINDYFDDELEIISNRDMDCEELKYIYSKFDYVIGTRFHSVIFSLAEGVPGIAISYSGNKATGIMRDMGLESFVIDANTISFEQLVEKFEHLKNYRDGYLRKVDIYNNMAQRNYTELCKLIKKVSYYNA